MTVTFTQRGAPSVQPCQACRHGTASGRDGETQLNEIRKSKSRVVEHVGQTDTLQPVVVAVSATGQARSGIDRTRHFDREA